MNKFALIAAVTAGTLSAMSASATNLVMNGDFETGTFASWTKSGNNDLSDIIANTVTSNHTYLWRSGATGSQAFISQTIATVAGQSYTLGFDFFNSATSAEVFTVDFNGVEIYSSANTVHGWSDRVTFSNLVASAAATVLTFGARNDPSFVRVDNITLEQNAAAVPESASWAMMLVGFGAMGAAMRRRKIAVSVG